MPVELNRQTDLVFPNGHHVCLYTNYTVSLKDCEYFEQVLSDFNNFGRDTMQKSGNQKLTYFLILCN